MPISSALLWKRNSILSLSALYVPSSFLTEAVQEIEKYSNDNPGEIIIVDVSKALGDDMANYADDEIHPSAQGNEIIANIILDKLEELVLGNDASPVIAEKGKDIEIPEIFTMSLRFAGNVFHAISVIYGFFAGIFA